MLKLEYVRFFNKKTKIKNAHSQVILNKTFAKDRLICEKENDFI
jgi:hypothetical protein